MADDAPDNPRFMAAAAQVVGRHEGFGPPAGLGVDPRMRGYSRSHATREQPTPAAVGWRMDTPRNPVAGRRKITLIPYIYAGDFSTLIVDEFAERDISMHYQDDTFRVDWADPDDFPALKSWLVETYGPAIRDHKRFALGAT